MSGTIDSADPIEAAHAIGCGHGRNGEKPAVAAHGGYIGHFPEVPRVHHGIGCEELIAVARPVSILVALEGSDTRAILCATDDDIGTVVVAEDIGVAEVVAERASDTRFS